jgi:PAS domain S-box-containing protein
MNEHPSNQETGMHVRTDSFFQSLIERSRDAVVVADAAGTIVYQSPGTLEQLGYSAGACLNRNIMEFVHPDDMGVVTRTIAAAGDSHGASHTMELRLLTGFGKWCWVEVRATNLLHVATVRGLVLNTIVIHERKALELQNAAARMDPHFLFNVLHSIATMIRDGQYHEAVDAILRLRKLTTGTVGVAEGRLVSLAAEWAWVEDYMALEQLRFGDEMRVRLTPLSSHLSQVRVPCRIVQPLAENAVKHGIGSRPGGGDLLVAAELDDDVVRISVVEHGEPREEGEYIEGLGIGLRTTQQRLQLHFGERASLSLEVSSTQSRAVLVFPHVHSTI